MKLEKLHNLIYDLNEEVIANELAGTLSKYHQALAQSIAQPAEDTSNAFTAATEQLDSAVQDSVADKLPPSDKRMLEQIGGSRYFGSQLRARLKAIIEEQSPTPGLAVTEIQKFTASATKFYSTLATLLGALDQLNIDMDFTGTNEYEIGVTLPPKIFKDNLDDFSKELKRVDRHLRAFGELAADDPSSCRIRAVADGSVDLFLSALPEVAAVIADSIQQLAILYLLILKIRTSRQDLQKHKVSKAALDVGFLTQMYARLGGCG